ncbi:MAG: indole-3-glycerol phosphate synthase TrpC [Ferruginibacter sp.]
MNILQTIIEHKKREVAFQKANVSIEELQQTEHYQRKTLSLKSFLLDTTKTGIIAEFKRKSPSKGAINKTAAVETVTKAYTANGASGLSVLTDTHFFGGSSKDLLAARQNEIPILKKDFIIDEYQLTEARSLGADVILLIAANLSPAAVKQLAVSAKSLQLEVLLEIHNEDELQHICDEVDMVGVNNRNLKTFDVDINTSIRLAALIPPGKIKISESGINDAAVINLLRRHHDYTGFLIGETFMKEADPAIAFASFVQQLNNYQ